MKLNKLFKGLSAIILLCSVSACGSTSISETYNSAIKLVTGEDSNEAKSDAQSQNNAGSSAASNQNTTINNMEAKFSVKEELAYCLTNSDIEAAVASTMVFVGEDKVNDLVKDDIASYLVGLCLPNSIDKRYVLNEYLLAKGSVHSFYVEAHLNDLVKHLKESGVELAIKTESYFKTINLDKDQSDTFNLKIVELIMKKDATLANEAWRIASHIDKLNKKQKQKALQISGLVRAHALKANYFLTRGIYVSQQITEQLAIAMKMTGKELLNKTRSGQLFSIDSLLSLLEKIKIKAGFASENSGTIFLVFVQDNGEAIGKTLINSVSLIKSFDTQVSNIPVLSEQQINADKNQLNDKWEFPKSFSGEGQYEKENQFVQP